MLTCSIPLKGKFNFSWKIKRWSKSKYLSHPSIPRCTYRPWWPILPVWPFVSILMLTAASAHWSPQPLTNEKRFFLLGHHVWRWSLRSASHWSAWLRAFADQWEFANVEIMATHSGAVYCGVLYMDHHKIDSRVHHGYYGAAVWKDGRDIWS